MRAVTTHKKRARHGAALMEVVLVLTLFVTYGFTIIFGLCIATLGVSP